MNIDDVKNIAVKQAEEKVVRSQRQDQTDEVVGINYGRGNGKSSKAMINMLSEAMPNLNFTVGE